jgi:hypothetical protein
MQVPQADDRGTTAARPSRTEGWAVALPARPSIATEPSTWELDRCWCGVGELVEVQPPSRGNRIRLSVDCCGQRLGIGRRVAVAVTG